MPVPVAKVLLPSYFLNGDRHQCLAMMEAFGDDDVTLVYEKRER